MRFFNIDLHISVIEDIATIFRDLGHEVTSWNMSGHNWVFNRPQKIIPELSNWRNFSQEMCDQFYKRYREELSCYDAFITCYPPCFSLLFEKFEKPIYSVVATRYDHPLSAKKADLEWLNQGIVRLIDSGQLTPIANNKFDQWYCQKFLLRKFKHIPSFCSYTKSYYRSGGGPVVASKGRIPDRGRIPVFPHVSDLGPYTWQSLYSHQCIIQIPYNVSLMSIFEQYTANVPLLVPTMDFGLRAFASSGFMSEVLFIPTCMDFNLPEVKEKASLLSDFYDAEMMPYINQFDSYEELNYLLQKLDFSDISEKIRRFNEKRKLDIYSLWSCTITNRQSP